MKYVYLILAIVAVALIVFNATYINLSQPFEGESLIAIISILSGICALMLLAALYMSKKIVQKIKDKKKTR